MQQEQQSILITGGMGFFGWNTAQYLRQRGITVHQASSALERYPLEIQESIIPLDVLSTASIQAALEKTKPTMLIHAAALSAPMTCEQQPEVAHTLNVIGTHNIANTVSVLDIPLVFLSTDLVFNGDKNTLKDGFYTESDTPDARIVYGKTKMSAEQIFLERTYANKQYERWIILRTSLMFGRGVAWANGFPHFALNLLTSGKTTTLFTDQFRTPAYIPDIAEAILQLIELEKYGEIYHCGGGERIDRVSFVERYCAIANVDKNGIIACSMNDVPNYTTRVRDVSLHSGKLHAALNGNWQPTVLDDAFRQIMSL